MNWRALFTTEPSSSAPAHFRHSLAFWAANLALVAAIYLCAVEPLRDAIIAGEAGLADRRAALARYEAVVSQSAAIEGYARQVAASNSRGEFIRGENDGLVEANLQAQLKAVAEEAKVTVRSLQMLPSKISQGVALVGARLEVTGSLPAIHALARKIEGEVPLLVVTDAHSRARVHFWGAAVDREPEIEASFDVFGAAAPRPAR